MCGVRGEGQVWGLYGLATNDLMGSRAGVVDSAIGGRIATDNWGQHGRAEVEFGRRNGYIKCY